MTPAERAIEAFGGKKALAEAVGRDVTRILRWTYPRGVNGGTGGLIPSDLQPIVLEKARKLGLPLTAEDLIGKPPKAKRRAA